MFIRQALAVVRFREARAKRRENIALRRFSTSSAFIAQQRVSLLI